MSKNVYYVTVYYVIINYAGCVLYLHYVSQLAKKTKSTFLTCLWHKIYSEEAVGLKSNNYTYKITMFVNTFLENLIFCQ